MTKLVSSVISIVITSKVMIGVIVVPKFQRYYIHFSLWLNEGFARYMQSVGAANVLGSNSGILDRFVESSTMAAMTTGIMGVFVQNVI